MINLFSHVVGETMSDRAYDNLVEEYEATCELLKQRDEQIKSLTTQLFYWRETDKLIRDEVLDLLDQVVAHLRAHDPAYETMSISVAIEKFLEKPWRKP